MRQNEYLWSKGLTPYQTRKLVWSSPIVTAFVDEKSMVVLNRFSLQEVKNIAGKGGMLVTSISSFPHNVFKSLRPRGRQKLGSYGVEVNPFPHNDTF